MIAFPYESLSIRIIGLVLYISVIAVNIERITHVHGKFLPRLLKDLLFSVQDSSEAPYHLLLGTSYSRYAISYFYQIIPISVPPQ
ncbi:hypothetical protein AR543_03920 [Paenibacillus bovis]|uniref:Uncharacterized protein n=1 Tax=Paenibacillus bovis TaxID=1616788 RepID=A0A172ZC86_9BACL|nr:hypothetical protein AR543_03920 [Paenibacillus bovis]